MREFKFGIIGCLVLLSLSSCYSSDKFGLSYQGTTDGMRHLDSNGIDAMFRIESKTKFQTLQNRVAMVDTLLAAGLGVKGELNRFGYYNDATAVAIFCFPNCAECRKESVVIVTGLPESPKVHGVYDWTIREYDSKNVVTETSTSETEK